MLVRAVSGPSAGEKRFRGGSRTDPRPLERIAKTQLAAAIKHLSGAKDTCEVIDLASMTQTMVYASRDRKNSIDAAALLSGRSKAAAWSAGVLFSAITALRSRGLSARDPVDQNAALGVRQLKWCQRIIFREPLM